MNLVTVVERVSGGGNETIKVERVYPVSAWDVEGMHDSGLRISTLGAGNGSFSIDGQSVSARSRTAMCLAFPNLSKK